MYKFYPPKNAPFDTKTNSYKVITSRYKKTYTKIDNERKNFMLSKNSNRNNYREHCINQIPRTALSEGWGGVFGGG